MNWTAIIDGDPPSAHRYLVLLSNSQGAVEYLVGWWNTPLDDTTEAHWVFEDLKGNEISTGACEPTHWCRIERPRDGAHHRTPS